MRYTIVDVFAEEPFGGNPLAVVHAAAQLDTATMQAIAREFNLSETTFIEARSAARARVRIFTPGEELPFAGHPALGTAWVVTRGAGICTLELAAGDVEVSFEGDLAWMKPPAPTTGPAVPAATAAGIVGLAEADLDPATPPQYMRCGPPYLFVAVRSRAALQRVRIAADLLAAEHARIADGGPAAFPFTFCREAYSDDADFAVRMMFSDGSGLREDPATGSACAALAAWLRARGERGRFVVEQGFEVGRPSRIYLDVGAAVRVGGKVRLVAEGRLV